MGRPSRGHHEEGVRNKPMRFQQHSTKSATFRLWRSASSNTSRRSRSPMRSGSPAITSPSSSRCGSSCSLPCRCIGSWTARSWDWLQESRGKLCRRTIRTSRSC